ncbi:hypothetical protein [Aeromonas sp. 95A]|uniref:hypothetical protein n=1 Tax=Aeromonas sp. 95A TaxID=3452729 RepID=UPI003F795B3D
MKQHYVCQFNPTELAATLAPLQGGKLTILLAEQDCAQVPLLQQLCRDFNIALDGAIFPQLIGAQGLLPQGAWLLPRANPYHAILLPLTPQASAVSLAHRIAEQVENMLATWPTPSPPPTLFLTFDNLIPNIASILDALYLQLANRVNYAGANAGSGSFTPLACLFDNQRQLHPPCLPVRQSTATCLRGHLHAAAQQQLPLSGTWLPTLGPTDAGHQQ